MYSRLVLCSLLVLQASGLFVTADNAKDESGGHVGGSLGSLNEISRTGPRSALSSKDTSTPAGNISNGSSKAKHVHHTSTSNPTKIALIITAVVVSVAIIIMIIILVLLWRQGNADPDYLVSSSSTQSWFKIRQPDDSASELRIVSSTSKCNSLSQGKLSQQASENLQIEPVKSLLPPLVVSGHLDSVISYSTNESKLGKSKQAVALASKCKAIQSKSRAKVSSKVSPKVSPKVNTAKCA